MWIYVGVMECRSLISATVTLVSGLEKMHPQQIAYIIYSSSSIFCMKIHLGSWRVINLFQVTVTLTSGFSSSKVEPRAYLYIYLRNKETQQTLRVIECIQYDASF